MTRCKVWYLKIIEKKINYMSSCEKNHCFYLLYITCRIKKNFDSLWPIKRLSWLWLYGSWIYNYVYLCNQCLSPLKLWVSNPTHGEVYWIQHYVIKFVSDLPQVGGFLWVLRFPPNKTDRHDITEILLKVVLNTINQPINHKKKIEESGNEKSYETVMN